MSIVRTFAVTALVILTLAALGTSPALAQGVGGAPMSSDERHEGIGIGVKGGWLFSDLTAEGIEFDQRSGWQVGAFFGGNRPGLVGVMAEVNYGKKGAKLGDLDYDVNFVSVPVVLRVNGGSKSLSGVSGYGIVGPQLDWLISPERDGVGVDIDDDTEGFELSLVAGAGVEITRFIVELRYIHGLRSISKTFDLPESAELKSKAFAILFGIRFN